MLEGTFVTVTGIRNYDGLYPFSIGKRFLGQKEPTNPFDSEAIKILDKGNEKVGYIANSTNTKLNGTMSAGRLYDKVGEYCVMEVCFSTKNEVICQMIEFDCKDEETILSYTTEDCGDDECDYGYDNEDE